MLTTDISHEGAATPPERCERAPVTACPLCRSAGATKLYRTRDALYGGADAFEVVRCRACGLVFVEDRPSDAALDGARGVTVPVVPTWADPVWQVFVAGFNLGSFPRAEKLANTVLSLPMGPHLTALELSDTSARLREFV